MSHQRVPACGVSARQKLGEMVRLMGEQKPPVAEETNTSLLELVCVAAQLIVDAGISESRAIGSTDQLDRRTYVRTVFALVEGVSFCQRRHAENDPQLTEGQRENARRAADAAWKAGQRAGEKMKACLRVRSGVAALATAHNLDDPLDTSSNAWQRFQEALEVRNRITHPRTLADCIVKDEDVALVREVHAWYQAMDMALTAKIQGASSSAE
jgi:hypothetical protein